MPRKAVAGVRRATTRPISRATTRASAAARRCSIRCRAWCWCRASACSASAAPRRTRASPPIIAESAVARHHRRRGDRPLSSRSPKPTCSTCEYWSLGAGQARQGARRSRWPARSRPSPAPAAPSARRRRRRSRRPAPRWRCSIVDVARGRGQGARRSASGARRRLRRHRCRLRVAPPSTGSCETFGGVDIVVSNAGAAWQGRIGEVDEAVLRKSFELNFFGHQRVAQAAVRIMLRAGHRRLPAVQRLQAGGEPGTQFRPLRPAQGGDAVPGAAVRGGLRRRRHPRQRASTPTASAPAC